MKVAAITAPSEMALTEIARPEPGPHEAILKVEKVGICGSDLHYFPLAPEETVMGHEFVGTIVEVGSMVSKLAVGDRVCSIPCIGCGVCRACLSDNPIQCEQVRLHGGEIPGMGAFGEFVLVGENECVHLPPEIPMATAALIEPLTVGLHLVERAMLSLDDRVLILGAGPIGLTAVLWARHMGVADILVSDPVESRRKLALQMGATEVVDPMASDLSEFAVELWGELPGVVIECMGRAGRYNIACEAAARGGRVILGGMMFESEQVDSMTPFMKGLSIEYVIQYDLRHFRYTINMLSQRRIDPAPLITGDISLEELPAMMKALQKPNEHCKVLVTPS